MPNTAESFRRLGDKMNTLDIGLMIANEDDPKSRATLVVLNSMNILLMKNTERVDENRLLLSNHMVEEAAMTNRKKGMWNILSWMLGIAQIACVAGITFIYNYTSEIRVIQQKNEIKFKELEYNQQSIKESQALLLEKQAAIRATQTGEKK